MAIRTISKRGLQFHGSLFKELDSLNAMADFSKASAIRGYSSSLSSNSTKLNSFSRYIDDHRLDSSNSGSLISFSRCIDTRQISQLASESENAKRVSENGKRVNLVDTLALVRKLESQGVPTKQAEAITGAIIEVLNDSLENVSQSFINKSEMQKAEHHFGMVQRETEKLQGDIEKMRSELRYEIDKLTAGQRLDLNLEKGRIRDELANQNAETIKLNNKIDQEHHSVRAHIEKTYFDLIKYCVGTLGSVLAVGLALLRYNQGK